MQTRASGRVRALPRIVQATQANADLLANLLLLATVIALVAYSTKLILGLDQAKEYLASAFERRFDADIHYEGNVGLQVALAILAMLVHLLICAAVCFAFHTRVAALAGRAGERLGPLVYLATLAILIVVAWPFYTFVRSIDAAFEDVRLGKDVLTVNLGPGERADQNIEDRLRAARLYYDGAVISCGLAALAAFLAHLRWPRALRRFDLAMCAFAVLTAAAFHVIASFLQPDLFRWFGGFALVFIGGAFVWTVVYLLITVHIPDGWRMLSFGVIGALILVKVLGWERTSYTPYRAGQILKLKPCSAEAGDFSALEQRVLAQLGLVEPAKLKELDPCPAGTTGQTRSITQQAPQTEYFEQKRQARSIAENFQKINANIGLRNIVRDISDQYAQGAKRYFGVPSVDAKIDGWITERRAEIEAASKERPYRIYIATAQGGGLYAAYHAAFALARLQDECPHFSRQLFAISAVSGGAVGAQLFTDLAHQRLVDEMPGAPASATAAPAAPAAAVPAPAAAPGAPAAGSATGGGTGGAPPPAPRCRTLADKGAYERAVQQFFLSDFQAPLIGTLLYADAPLLVLPKWLSLTDRAIALGRSFESGWDRMWERLAVIRVKQGAGALPPTAGRYFFSDATQQGNGAPATIVNATVANNGMPLILAPFYFSNFYSTLEEGSGSKNPKDWAFFRFAHFFDLMPGMDVPLATAVLLGARFPYVTPGGRFPVVLPTRQEVYKSDDVALADGGYYDNTGTATALALSRRIERRLEARFRDLKDKIDVQLVRMVDPNKVAIATVAASPGEAVLPLATLYFSRLFTRDFYLRMIRDADTATHDLTFDADQVRAPLSWQLSRSTRKRIETDILDKLKDPSSSLARLRVTLDQ